MSAEMTALVLGRLPALPGAGLRPPVVHSRPPDQPLMPAPGRGGASAPSQVGHVTCLGCGCACDDIVLTIAAGRITVAERACPPGIAWFGDGFVPDQVLADGKPAELEAALDRAAALLAEARGGLLWCSGRS